MSAPLESAVAGEARLRVALLSLPDRTRAVMEYFILGPGRGTFSQTGEDHADVVIVDHDNPESREHWAAFRTRGRARPALVLSVLPIDSPEAIWIQKPAMPAALLAAAARLSTAARGSRPAARVDPFSVAVAAAHLRQTATHPLERPAVRPMLVVESRVNTTREEVAPTAPVADSPAIGPSTPAPAPIAPIEDPRYCGNRPDLTPVQIAADPDLFYKLEGTLLYVLKDAFFVARKWKAQTHLERPEGGISLDPNENRAYLGCTDDALQALAGSRLDRALRVQTMTTRDFKALHSDASRSVSIRRADALLWEVALLTAAGRLPVGTDLNRSVYVKSWPNLTRLLPLPNAMRIVALFAVRGATLAEAPRLLGVPQRHVFACYNGLLALDLVTSEGGHGSGAEKPHKNRAIIQRLFRWLRGKA